MDAQHAGQNPPEVDVTQPHRPTDREMMAIAVAAMRESVPARDKLTPLVGAAIRLPDGSSHQAYRAFRRDGETAEHSLFERTDLDKTDLTGAHLFVTLEPCSPGSRGVREIPCAERVADARISDVWIGIADPWPRIDGKWDRLPQQTRYHSPSLHAGFSGRDPNSKRGMACGGDEGGREQQAPPAAGDLFDRVFPRATVADLSINALKLYRTKQRIKARHDSPEFRAELYSIGAIDGLGADAHLTGFGIIAFANRPRRFVHHAGLQAVVHVSNDSEHTASFDEPAVLIPDLVEAWLHAKLPDAESRDTAVRRTVERLPYKAIREAVLNALVHRDYRSETARIALCHLSVTDTEITVKSPGGPIPPLTLYDLQALRAGVYTRNQRLAIALAGADVMERQNLGMKTLLLLPEAGFPLPRYTLEGGFLALTIFRTFEALAAVRARGKLTEMNADERRGWAYVAGLEVVTRSEYAKAMGYDIKKAQRHLAHFAALGLMRLQRAGRSSSYHVLP